MLSRMLLSVCSPADKSADGLFIIAGQLSKTGTVMNRSTVRTDNRDASPVIKVPPEQVNQVVAVLCDAFYDYPVTRYVIGPISGDYRRHVHTLVNFFVMARVLRGEPMLAVHNDSDLVAAAVLTLPGEPQPPVELAQLRESVWRELGPLARLRYEAFAEATQKFDVSQPHYHLNMIGVRRSHCGRGLARQLLEAVHAMSRSDPDSHGVTLTTEDPRNVSLYQHFGYEIVGQTRIDAKLETWGFFRPNGVSA